jgi:hypothetical protein
MTRLQYPSQQRLAAEAGIAIGPILFIIAILAILAAAIAAGSGSFTAGTSSEGNRTKASAIIQIGENLKIGLDRLTMENGVVFGAIDFNVSNTSTNNAMFSPSGGGITAPSDTLANTPGSDHWLYPVGAVPGLGTVNEEQLAVLRVSPGVCDEINNKADALSTPGPAALGNFADTSNDTAMLAAWPSTFNGRPVGCVNNSDSGSSGDYFYEVLYVQ